LIRLRDQGVPWDEAWPTAKNTILTTINPASQRRSWADVWADKAISDGFRDAFLGNGARMRLEPFGDQSAHRVDSMLIA
jgi:hypothetical protein